MKFLILASLCGLALCISDVAQFRQLQNESRRQCRLGGRGEISRKCLGARTLDDIYAEIPGGYQTVRAYAKPDFRKTLELCAERNSGEGNDWRNIRLARGKLLTPAHEAQWKDCDAQIKKEEADCKNAMDLVCAFSQGTNFDCASESQMRRSAGTIENDQCFLFSAYVDGRPSDAREFRQRLIESKKDCRKESDVIASRCLKEKTMTQLLNQLPPTIRWQTNIPKHTDLGKTVEKCLAREEVGWPQMRQQVMRVLRGVANAQTRKECLDQLRREEKEDCADAHKIVCAYTYGQDISCASERQRSASAPTGNCDAVLNAIRASDIRK